MTTTKVLRTSLTEYTNYARQWFESRATLRTKKEFVNRVFTSTTWRNLKLFTLGKLAVKLKQGLRIRPLITHRARGGATGELWDITSYQSRRID